MKTYFSEDFKKELNIPSGIYLSAWEEVTEETSEWSIISLCFEGISKSLNDIKHTDFKTLWNSETKTLQFNLENFDITIPDDGSYQTAMNGYVKSLRFYYGYEDTVRLAFVLVPESDEELNLTGNNIISLQFLESTRAEFTNYKKDIINDFDFLEGVSSGIKNILVISPEDEVLISKDSYYRLLRKRLSEEGCKEGSCIDKNGGYQNSYYTFRTYKEGTLKPILFDSNGSILLTKHHLNQAGGYIQIRGTVEYEEFRTEEDGKITKIRDGITEISGVDGVCIVADEVSPTFTYMIDNTWDRIVYAMQVNPEETLWGIFHIELSFLDKEKQSRTISSKRFKLVQGNFESYAKIVNPTTTYTEYNNYLFLFEADGTTLHKFTVEVLTDEVIEKENVYIFKQDQNQEELDYMNSKFDIKIGEKSVTGNVVRFDVEIVTKQVNPSDSIPIPEINGEFKLIPLEIGLKNTDISYKPSTFYLVQKPKTQKLKIFTSLGPSVNIITLENDQPYAVIALGLDSQVTGDYWKLTQGIDGVSITGFDSGEINCFYNEETGEGNFNDESTNKIAVVIDESPLQDKFYGTLQFTRYSSNPQIVDVSNWRMNLYVSTASLQVYKKGLPPFLTVPNSPVEVDRVKALSTEVTSNQNLYCRFVPAKNRFYSGQYDAEYSLTELSEMLEANPEYNMKIYVPGQTEEETHIGNNLYYIKNDSGDPVTIPLVLETMFFEEAFFKHSSGPSLFGVVEFSFTQDFLNIEGTININIVKDSSLDTFITFNTREIEYAGEVVNIEKKVLNDQYFFVPHDEPMYLTLYSNFSIFYSVSDTVVKGVFDSEKNSKISLSSVGGKSSGLNIFTKILRLMFPTYESGVLKGFKVECFNTKGYADFAQNPTRFFVTNRKTFKNVTGGGLVLYFFRFPMPLLPKWVGYTNYRSEHLLSSDYVSGTNNTYLGESWNIISDLGDPDAAIATITYSEVKEKIVSLTSQSNLGYYPSDFFAKLIIPLSGKRVEEFELKIDVFAITEFSGGVRLSHNPYTSYSSVTSSQYRIKKDTPTDLKNILNFSLISNVSYNSDADQDGTDVGTVYLYFRPDILHSEPTNPIPPQPFPFYDAGNAEYDSTLTVPPYDNDIEQWSNETKAQVGGRYGVFFYLIANNWDYDDDEAGLKAEMCLPADRPYFVKFVCDLLTSGITLNLRYIKDKIYLTGVEEIPFIGGNTSPAVNYSALLVGNSIANNSSLATNCVAESIGSDVTSNKLTNIVKISCSDRSCVIQNYANHSEEITALTQPIEWSAEYTISVIKQGEADPEPGHNFTARGVQQGHNSGIIVDNDLYVGRELGTNNHINVPVASGDESVELNCKVVSLSTLETISGMEILCDSSVTYAVDSENNTITFSFTKNNTAAVRTMNCAVLYQNSDGVTDEVTFVINQAAISPIIQWPDSTVNGNLIPFLSDGTCIATHSKFSNDVLVSTSIDILANVNRLKVTDSTGTLNLEEYYTGDLYEGEVSENNDILYRFVIDLQLPFNNTRSARNGVLTISTENDSSHLDINFSQGYYIVLLNNKTAQEFSGSSNFISLNSFASSYEMRLSAERREFMYSSNQWVLQSTDVSLPQVINGYWASPEYFICDSEGIEQSGSTFNEFFSSYTLEELTTASYKPTLILTNLVSSTPGEINFCVSGLKIILSGEAFYKNTYNYMYYGDSLEFSFNLYFTYVME